MENKKTTALVVDDEVDFCSLIEKFLDRQGYAVTIANNGQDAIDVVKTTRPEIIILDVRMPVMGGVEALSIIRKIDKDVEVIMLTATHDTDTVVTALREGASDYIQKPVVFAELKHSLDKAVERRKFLEQSRNFQKQLEEKLDQRTKEIRRSERMMKTITSSANDAIIMINGDGKVIFWNPAAERMFGFTEDEMIGTTLEGRIIPAAYRLQHLNGLESFRKDGKGGVIGKSVEVTALRKDGAEFPIELGLSAVRVDDHWQAVAVIRDVTERKAAEEELRRSKEYLARIVETIAEGIYIVDTDGKIVFANQAAEEIFGIAREELYNRTYNDSKWNVKNGNGKVLSQEDYPFSIVKTTGRPVYGIEILSRRPDETEITVSINAAPLYDEGGNFQGMVATQQDITARKNAENEIRRANREKEQLITAMPSILISLDAGFKVKTWNSAAMETFGIDQDAVLNANFFDSGIDWNWDDIKQSIDACRKTGKPVFSGDIRYLGVDGKEGFIGFSINPILDKVSGNGYLMLGSELTERRILESQLAQAQKLESIGSLAAGIAHEINTPTQFVGDNIHFLDEAFSDTMELVQQYRLLIENSDEKKSREDILESMREAEENADLEFLEEEVPKAISSSLKGVERVSTIVRAMKDFSHPGSKEKMLVDLNKTIESTITISRNEWKYVSELTTDYDPTMGMVPCYPDEFNQVILNLITNAAHAISEKIGENSEEKGTITIKTTREGDFAVVTVSDTGGGIPDSIKDKVFDHFFTTKEVGRGTGQGLSISRSIIVEKHGGSITLHSEVGVGTTFIIRLPMDQEP